MSSLRGTGTGVEDTADGAISPVGFCFDGDGAGSVIFGGLDKLEDHGDC